MITFIFNKYKSSKSLIHYFFLTYIDKIISFALPLSILLIIKDKPLYNFVEAAFSYAALLMIVIELGISNYLFFGYKNAVHKEEFLRDACRNFRFLLLMYSFLSVAFLVIINSYDGGLIVLSLVVIIRTLFTFYLNFQANIFRLRDRPSGIYVVSLSVNIISFVLLLSATYWSWIFTIGWFFLAPLLLVIGVCWQFLIRDFRNFSWAGFITFLSRSLGFSWPIILNVLAMSFINNYAKIYAFGHLSEQEMLQISYIMRIGLVIQLTHSAFSSFFSKSLFMQQTHVLNVKMFKQYNLLLLFSILVVLFIILMTNVLFKNQLTIPFSLSTFLFLMYIVLWCYIGYLELYFGIMNANRRILYYSAISSLIYIVFLKLGSHISLLQLSAFMVISTGVNLLLVLLGLHKLQVITLKIKTKPVKKKA